MLAKDPARLARVSDRVALDQLLPEIVDDHRHLTRDKDLSLTLAPLPPCEILAPLPIVQAAIGNLLRNAIEHSDRGEITIRLEAPATVVIDDPGHGMTPEEISAIYARVARGGGERDGGGIGLDLISRLCEHLGWQLDIASDEGTRDDDDAAFHRLTGPGVRRDDAAQRKSGPKPAFSRSSDAAARLTRPSRPRLPRRPSSTGGCGPACRLPAP